MPLALTTARPLTAVPPSCVKFPLTTTRPSPVVARAATVLAGAVSVAAAVSGDGFQPASTAPVLVSTAARPERFRPPMAVKVPPT